MIVRLKNDKKIDFAKGFDLSITLSASENNPLAWYVEPPRFEPVRTDNWIGAVKEGGAVNFRDIYFNPHGHGTHTECLGHITREIFSINDSLHQFFFNARLVSVQLKEVIQSGVVDRIITAENLRKVAGYEPVEALIVRTLPNSNEKMGKNYSASNPPYFDTQCLHILEDLGVKHLLVDLPSVDKELDGGILAFHHGFWCVPENPQKDKTITEFIFVADEIQDGEYILNLQVANFENDAAPSRPVIYKPF